jgi:hypothetical protein
MIALVAAVVIGSGYWIVALESTRHEAIGFCEAIGLVAVDSATSGSYVCIEGVPVP